MVRCLAVGVVLASNWRGLGSSASIGDEKVHDLLMAGPYCVRSVRDRAARARVSKSRRGAFRSSRRCS